MNKLVKLAKLGIEFERILDKYCMTQSDKDRLAEIINEVIEIGKL